jgi:hypothetical protein
MGLKEAYLEKREAELHEWDAEIKLLEARAAKLKAEATIQYYEDLRSLRAKRNTAHEKLHELRLASGEAWNTIKVGVENAWLDLKGALKSAAAKLK